MAFWTFSSILSEVLGSNASTLPLNRTRADKVINAATLRMFFSGEFVMGNQEDTRACAARDDLYAA
jgi:hypothetical protein